MIGVVKPSMMLNRRLPLRNAPRLHGFCRVRDSQRIDKHRALTSANGKAPKTLPRSSIAPNAMLASISTSSASASPSTLPALALPSAALSWAFALATLHAAALVLLVR